jgi:hypothetical protein
MLINLVVMNLPLINILRRGHKISHPTKEGYSRIQGKCIFQL